MNALRLAIVSFGFLGCSPFAPGTVGTLGGVAIALLMRDTRPFLAWVLVVCAFLYVVGRSLGPWSEAYAKKKDPGIFVLDEVIGYLITVAWVTGPSPLTLVVGSRLLARLQGAREAEVSLGETVSAFERLGRNALKVELAITVGDKLTISADGNELGSWTLDVQPDLPPSAGFLKRPNKTERLSLRLDYKARDDFGLTTMTAEIRRVAAPDDPPIELDLFLDNRNRTDVRGTVWQCSVPGWGHRKWSSGGAAAHVSRSCTDCGGKCRHPCPPRMSRCSRKPSKRISTSPVVAEASRSSRTWFD